jgi:hypothetical protein
VSGGDETVGNTKVAIGVVWNEVRKLCCEMEAVLWREGSPPFGALALSPKIIALLRMFELLPFTLDLNGWISEPLTQLLLVTADVT